MIKILGGIVLVLLLAGGALLLAIRNNGPAVLDAVDRIAGGKRDVVLVEKARYGDAAKQKVRVYRQGKDGEPIPVFLFVHGGSWRWGDPDDYGFVARAMAPEGYLVVLAAYRLGESGRYPAMLEDTAAAIAWTRANAARLGGDPDRIVLAGHSAGAYNVVQVTLEPRWLAARGVPEASIRGVVGLAGPYDFFPFDSDSTRASFGSVGAGAESQPVNHARADAPPMLLVHGEEDTLVKPRNTRALAAALEAKGSKVETLFYPDADHNAPLIWLAAPWRDRRDVAARIVAFVRENTAVSVPVQAGKP
ncbi:alpha/beta hydrolase [Qipengyuania sp. RANM35]|uniref:alpha/beta hydrolase n=1 Tax=Qipengyuania sp. RANM35 TaxID=3068635 RepID=UPI0034DAC14C